MRSLHAHLIGGIVIALATLLQSSVIADNANWTGGGDGSTYSQIANWDTAAVPINNGTTYDVIIGGTPSVLFDAGVGANTVDSLSLAQGATFTVNPGLTLNVLGVSNVGGRINVNNSTFSSPSATSMFSGRPYLFADNNGNIDIAAASWAATYSDSQTIMRADNATISLATLGSLTANDNTSYTDTLTVHATNGGLIDLSGMTSASSSDVLRFLVESGGNILFNSLSTTNKVQFDIHVPELALPSLNTANSTQFIARSGNAITANAMTDQAGGSVTLETNAIFNATALQQMRNTTLSAENGAVFNAPVLTDVAGSTLNLDPGFTFTSGVLNNVDGARFFVSGGLAFSGVSATAMTGTYSDSQTVIRAEGTGSSIDLSSLTALSLNDDTSYTDTLTVHARDNGVVNLSGLTSASSNNVLQFLIESGGDIPLANLNTTSNVRFDVDVPAYSLPSLGQASGTTFDIGPGSTLTANALTAQLGGSTNLQTNATMNATSLQQMRNTTLSAENGAVFNAPVLADVAGSTLHLDSGFTFTSGSLGNVDSSRFFVSGGLNFSGVSATAMSGTYSDSQTILQAEGVGSVLNLSSLQSLTANDNTSYTDTLTVRASAGGKIDLSGLASASSSDILQFQVQSNGSIVLTNLNSVSRVSFDIDVPTYVLPSLTQTSNTTFDVGPSSTLDANALTGQNGGSVTLRTGATMNATSLQQMRNTTLSAENGAVFNAPVLSDVAGSTLHLDSGFTFTSGSLGNVDSSRFFVSGGLNFSGVSATAMSGTYSDSQTILQAEGVGSVLNLSSLQSLTANDNTSYTDTLTVRASAGGKINLSGVNTVSTSDKILFHVQSQSEIDLSSLQVAGSGQYEFRVEAEGTLKLGDFTVTNNTAFNINDATSVVNVGGSLLLDNPSTFNVATGGGVSVAGNFSFATTSETAFQCDDGILTMNGSGTFASPQWLEVGGQDLGLPTSPLDVPGDDGNFAIGQLVVGQDGQSTVVQLADAIDNGNRSSFEALYLPGLGGDGLEMFGDSVLNIESINVYAFLDGDWTHLNSLFTDGITEIEFSSLVSDPEANGRIVVPEPATLVLFALGLVTAGLCGRRWK